MTKDERDRLDYYKTQLKKKNARIANLEVVVAISSPPRADLGYTMEAMMIWKDEHDRCKRKLERMRKAKVEK